MSSRSCGMTKMSATPPMRSEVWKPSGSLNRTSPRISPSMLSSIARAVALAHSARGFEPGQELGADLADVTGPQGHHEIAAPADVDEVLHHHGTVAPHVRHVAMRMRADPFREIGGGDAGNRRFPRRIDVHHQQHVRLVEGGEELLTQVERARVAMRLEHGHYTTVEPRLGGGEGRANLGGMVAVVVDHRDASHRAPDLEAA